MAEQIVRLGVVGAAGKMGRTLVSMIQEAEGLTLVAAVEQPGVPHVGRDAGEVAGIGNAGVAINDDLVSVMDGVDVLIDFTLAEATLANLAACRSGGTAMVIGTTGLSAGQQQALQEAAGEIPIVHSGNFSLGINAALQLVEMAARIFGDGADVEIVEAHHRHKVDAPSGTALMLGERVAQALDRDLDLVSVHGRQGQTQARQRETIGFHAIRGGEIVGEHRVMFIAGGERLEIAHAAQSRANFAEGALRAATWVAGQPAGLYDMEDVLSLKG